jgi:tetratricopeptide (TPR) repeat protein
MARGSRRPKASAKPAPEPAIARGPSLLPIFVGLAVLTIVAFARVAGNAFLELDDRAYVADNPRVVAGLTWKGIVWAFESAHAANYSPVTLLSHMLDCEMFGMSAAGHHLTSLAWHVASTLLLFHLLRKTTKATWPSAFVAAMFALHPLHVESVAWIAERKDVLSTFFWIATTLAYVVWTERRGAARYALVLLLFALGLLSKPMLVTLPFTLLLLDVWPLARTSKGFLALVVEKIPLFVLSVAASIGTYVAQRAEGATELGERHTLLFRLANAAVSCATYVWKTVWPAGLFPQYPYAEEGHPAWKVALSLAVVAALTVLLVAPFRKRPWLAVGWLWFLGTLVPVIGIVQVGEQAMADRFTYVPMIGLAIAIAFGAAELASTSEPVRRAARVLAPAILLVWAGLSWRQLGYWKDDATLFGHVVDVMPTHHVAHGALGNAAFAANQYDVAIREYTEARTLNPGYAQWAANLGVVLARVGRTDAARKAFEDALAIDPRQKDAHHNLGLLLAGEGKYDEAIAHFEASLAKDPDQYMVLYNLGVARKLQGKRAEAITAFEKSLDLAPGFAQARTALEQTRAGR